MMPVRSPPTLTLITAWPAPGVGTRKTLGPSGSGTGTAAAGSPDAAPATSSAVGRSAPNGTAPTAAGACWSSDAATSVPPRSARSATAAPGASRLPGSPAPTVAVAASGRFHSSPASPPGGTAVGRSSVTSAPVTDTTSGSSAVGVPSTVRLATAARSSADTVHVFTPGCSARCTSAPARSASGVPSASVGVTVAGIDASDRLRAARSSNTPAKACSNAPGADWTAGGAAGSATPDATAPARSVVRLPVIRPAASAATGPPNVEVVPETA